MATMVRNKPQMENRCLFIKQFGFSPNMAVGQRRRNHYGKANPSRKN
jgi:hypothetical protein